MQRARQQSPNPSEVGVRLELEAYLCQPVPDELWDILKEDGYYDEVVGREPGAMDGMCRRARKLLALGSKSEPRRSKVPAHSKPVGDVGTAPADVLRSEAIAELLAMEASSFKDSGGHELLTWQWYIWPDRTPFSPKAADEWIQVNRWSEQTAPGPTAYLEIPMSVGEFANALEHGETTATVRPQHRAEARYRHLRIRMSSGDVQIIPTYRSGELERLRQWSEELAICYPWTVEDAAWWVLTRESPPLRSITHTVRVQAKSPALGRFSLEVDPQVSPAGLATYYSLARKSYWQEWGGKVSQMHARLPDPARLEMVIFVAPRLARLAVEKHTDIWDPSVQESSELWQEIWQDWICNHPDRQFASDEVTMKANYKRVQRQLLGSSWLRRTTSAATTEEVGEE